jgi:formate hydrogenlyase transcriptional activator
VTVDEAQNRADFEHLVAEVSSRLVNANVDNLERHLQNSIERLGTFFELDRIQVTEFSVGGGFRVVNTWASPGVEPAPIGALVAAQLPEVGERVARGETVSIARCEDLSAQEYGQARQTWLEMGTRSHLSMPIVVGGSVIAALTTATVKREESWGGELAERIGIFASLFGIALERRNTKRALDEAIREEEMLKARMRAEADHLQEQVLTNGGYQQVVGESDAIRSVMAQVERVAATGASVLILGETGTGKELIARTIHRRSARDNRPLIKVNCAALPSSLIESELFGHERGAFTGALRRKMGRFELADGGTILLDEVGDIPFELQGKLLRVLQDGEFERVGSSETLTSDVRVISATNRDLRADIEEQQFRADLYYRLSVVPIEVPPLRERREDIPLLAWHFVRKFETLLGKTIRRIPAPLVDALVAYDWPGNVRELANVIERSMILSSGDALVIGDVLVMGGASFPEISPILSEPNSEDLDSIQRAHIVKVLDRCGWKVKGPGNAAERLGLNPSTLRARMKKLGIARPE